MSEKSCCKPTPPPVVSPGECGPGGCPPPTRIECIAVDKIYDSCFQVEDRTRSFTVDFCCVEEGQLLRCQLTPGQYISCQEISRTDVGGGFFSITLLVTVPITVWDPEHPDDREDLTFTFTKTVTLCAPEEASIDCSESTLVACSCFVSYKNDDSATINCDIQVCLVIKAVLKVQLLVPSYGFCSPAPCVTLPGVCPPTPPAQCF